MNNSLKSPVIPPRIFYRALFHENNALLRAVLLFNSRLHAREKGLGMAQLGLDDTVLNGLKDFDTLCNDISGMNCFGFWDFEDDSRRLMLVENEVLKKSIQYWGAAFCAPAIRQVVLKDDRMTLEQEMGKDLIAYAMGRGGFSLGNARQLVPTDPKDLPEKIADKIRAMGINAFLTLAGGWPSPLKHEAGTLVRELFKEYPPHESASGFQIPVDRTRVLWRVLKNIFLREVAPQWHPCFS